MALDAVPLLRPDEAFCHVTALELWGLPLPERDDRSHPVVHVGGTVSRQRRRPQIVAHRYAGFRVLTQQGLPLVDPVEAWVEAAPDLDVDDVVAVGDALAGTWSSSPVARLVPLTALHAAVAASGGRPGAPVLRRAVRLVRARVDSPQETRLRLLVLRGGLPEPEVNERRWGSDGTYLGRPDLSWPTARVALEYEGDHHRTDRATFRSDIRRRERFADHGWDLVRATAPDLVPPGAIELLARLRRRLVR